MIALICPFNPRGTIKIQACRSGWAFSIGAYQFTQCRKNRVDLSTDLNPVEKLLLLSQLYVGRLKGSFMVKDKNHKSTILGEVRELSPQEISIRTDEGYRLIRVDDILAIQLCQEEVDD